MSSNSSRARISCIVFVCEVIRRLRPSGRQRRMVDVACVHVLVLSNRPRRRAGRPRRSDVTRRSVRQITRAYSLHLVNLAASLGQVVARQQFVALRVVVLLPCVVVFRPSPEENGKQAAPTGASFFASGILCLSHAGRINPQECSPKRASGSGNSEHKLTSHRHLGHRERSSSGVSAGTLCMCSRRAGI